MRIIVTRLVLMGTVALLLATCAAPSVAQRILLFEDFEFATPDHPDPAACLAEGQHTEVADACIGTDSVDIYNRSRTLPLDPAFATVTGGSISDPFPTSHANFPESNQSMVLRNPNSATQMAVTFFSIFPDYDTHPNFFLKEGVVEFDAYVNDLQSDGLWGFLGVRLGFEFAPEDRSQVTTEGDQVVWHTVRMQEGGVATDPKLGFVDEDAIYDRTLEQLVLVDPDTVDQEAALHFRYELNDGTFNFFVDNLNNADPPVMVAENQEWEKVFDFTTFEEVPAPGINEISFMSDASGRSVPGTETSPDVFIDNIRIVDNLRAPHGPGEREDLAFSGQASGNGFSFTTVSNVLEGWEAKSENDGSWYQAELGPGQNGIIVEVTDGALVEVGMPSRRGYLDDSDSYVLDPEGAGTSLGSNDRLVFDEPIGPGNTASSFVIGDISGDGARSFPIFLASSGTSFTITPIGSTAGPAADFDGDGDVDGDDLAAWEDGFSLLAGASKADGDADGDGTVVGLDLMIWQREHGPPAAAAAVPEPMTAAMLVLLAAATSSQRGRRH